MNRKNVGALILAAGSSIRMGTPKALLPFDESTTFLDKIISTYLQWGCNEIVIVINKTLAKEVRFTGDQAKTVTFVENDHLEFERFYSVKLGLQKMKKSAFCFIQNVDNPFLTQTILNNLYRERSNEAYVVPTFEDKGGHPILLNNKTMLYLCSFSDNTANLRQVLGEMPCKKVKVQDSHILVNINESEEYERLMLLKKRKWNQFMIR
jgi:molybdenum cofactor cytidylyltransferase